MNINLNMRYPESRQEDITDAFTRGYTEAVEASNNAIKKLEAENAKLRALVADMLLFMPESTPHEYPFSDEFKRLVRVKCDALRELGIEVDE